MNSDSDSEKRTRKKKTFREDFDTGEPTNKHLMYESNTLQERGRDTILSILSAK